MIALVPADIHYTSYFINSPSVISYISIEYDDGDIRRLMAWIDSEYKLPDTFTGYPCQYVAARADVWLRFARK